MYFLLVILLSLHIVPSFPWLIKSDNCNTFGILSLID